MFSPYRHQIDAQSIMREMELKGKGGFLADAMGLGKTATMAMFLKENKINDKTDLIICPPSLLKNWYNEIIRVKDYPTPSTEPSILIYHGAKRVKEMKTKNWDYIITTYSLIGNGELKDEMWGRIIIDESHTIKNGIGSKASKCALAVIKIGKNSEKNWCISGTPFNNNIKDIASQCKFLGTTPYNNPNWWSRLSSEAVEIWKNDFVIQRSKEGLLQDPIYYNISITPSRKENEIINILRNNTLEKFKLWKKAFGNNKIQLQAKILALITKLRIISNSIYCGIEEIDADEVLTNSCKVSRIFLDMQTQLEADPKKGIVVFSQYIMFLDVLEKVINQKMNGVEVLKFTGSLNTQQRERVVKSFNENRNPRILLISIGAGNTGISLHHGSSTVFISEPNYNPFVEKQAEERVHRLGQLRQVQVFRYEVENSVETWINGLKSRKMKTAMDIRLLKTNSKINDYSKIDLKNLFNDFVSFFEEDLYQPKDSKKE